MSEELIIKHCAPTLAGIKTGNLFSCEFLSEEEMRKDLCKLNRLLGPKGIRILPMRFSNNRALIYFYRPKKLKTDFEDYRVGSLLREHGYSHEYPARCVVQIAGKLRADSDFPHEIGLFLGYPIEDVKGFMENKEKCCNCKGCWKVYGDEERAKRLFTRYKRCTAWYYHQWKRGKSIEQLLIEESSL